MRKSNRGEDPGRQTGWQTGRQTGQGPQDFDQFFRGVFPKAVAVAQKVTGDRASAEDAGLEALASYRARPCSSESAPCL